MSKLLLLPSTEKRDNVDDGVQRLSQLPNDVLIDCILSRLHMKEVAKTLGLTSQKFRYAWRYCKNIELISEGESQELDNFNHVLGLHFAPWIDRFFIDISSGRRRVSDWCFDYWVHYALCKRVQFLYLRFRKIQYGRWWLHYYDNAHFNTLGLDLINNVPSVATGITFLRSLHLEAVSVNAECLEHLFSCCHQLEHVRVIGSPTLRRLNVTSSSLKSLHLFRCYRLAHLEIDANKLGFFLFNDCHPGIDILYKCAPCLVEAEFGGACTTPSYPIFRKLSFVANQLTTLTMEISQMVWLAAMSQHRLAKDATFTTTFCNVKHLTLRFINIKTLFILWRFIEACPRLYKLKLQQKVMDSDQLDETYEQQSMLGLRFRRVDPVPALAILEMAGLIGSQDDFRFISNIIDVAVSLETIIWDPNGCYRTYLAPTSSDLIQTSRYRARSLKKIVPPKVKLLLL